MAIDFSKLKDGDKADLSAHLKGTGAKPSKYRNRKTTVDGIVFDSAKEARRYQELRLLEKAHVIRGLTRQHRWPLFGQRNEIVCYFVSDFDYWIVDGDLRVVEDVKSPITRKNPTYRLKSKLFMQSYGLRIREV